MTMTGMMIRLEICTNVRIKTIYLEWVKCLDLHRSQGSILDIRMDSRVHMQIAISEVLDSISVKVCMQKPPSFFSSYDK